MISTDTTNNNNNPTYSAIINYLHGDDCLIFYALIRRALVVCQPEIFKETKIKNKTMSKKSLRSELIYDFSHSEFLRTDKENGSLDKSLYLIFDDISISGANTERFEKLNEINSEIMSGHDGIEEAHSKAFNNEWEKIILEDKYYFTFLEARMYMDFIKPESEVNLKIQEGFQHLYNMRIGYFPDFLQKRIEDEYYKNVVTADKNVEILNKINKLKEKGQKLFQISRLRKCKDAQELIKCDTFLNTLINELAEQPKVLLNFERKKIKGKDYFINNLKYINRQITRFSKVNKIDIKKPNK